MASPFLDFDKQSDVGRMKVRGLQMIREGREVLRQARLIELQMRDGNGSQDAHYALNATEQSFTAGGYATANAAARASFEEVDSLHSKLIKAAGDGDEVGAAIDQCTAKHGV